MSPRVVVFLVLILNALAVAAALVIYGLTGKSSFGESGFITLISGAQLLLISGIAFRIRKRQALGNHASPLWIIIALGFLFLAADEFFKIHEGIDALIHGVFELEVTATTDRLDDLIIALYGLAGIGVLLAFRRVLKTYRQALPLLVLGFVLMFVMVALDMIGNQDAIVAPASDPDRAVGLPVLLSFAEDSIKIFAEAFFLLGFYIILQAPGREEA